MKEQFQDKAFRPESLAIIDSANEIIEEYQDQDLCLTLRQLYYQFVSRDLLENTVRNYKRLGDIISDARLAGLVDWDAIEDRTRNLEKAAHWESPKDILDACIGQYRIDRWANQESYVEVWIEKEALAGVFSESCGDLDVPFFACRGYTSASEMYSAGKRMGRHLDNGRHPVVIHFGDHDPSGIDMTRDLADRLSMFAEGEVEVQRIALNFDQIEQYSPPPNPAKATDPRFASYQIEYGDESWELDALDPRTLRGLIQANVEKHIDRFAWSVSLATEKKHIAMLQAAKKAMK
jgi:hypothetical protein